MSLSLGKDGFVLEVLGDGREALHFHRALELMYVLEGTVEVTVNGQETKLCPQDVFLVNVNKPHELVAADDALYVRLTIGYEIVRDVFNDYDLLFICDSTEVDDPSYEGLRSLLKSLLAQYLSGHCHAESLMSLSLCYHIADYLCANYLFRSKDLDHDASTGKRDDRIKAIDGYIMSNFDQPISLKEAAGTLGLSVGYLSRVFKRHYGMTFNSYLTKVRLLHAVDDLLSTSEPITRVAHDNGFSSTTSFNKSFKEEYHETPSDMQRKASSKRERDVAADESRMECRLERYAYHDVPGDVASAGASLEEAAVDVTTTEPLRTPWSEVINVGSAEDLLSSEVQRHVAVLKEKVGFKYVRLWTPFSREMLLDLGRPGESFNFSRLDNVLDFLLKIGAKPFIDLSSKPRRILRGIDDPLVFDDSGISQDLETWEQVIDAFMRHLCHRYQPDEVEQWKFELWFDDNSFDDPACRSAYRKLFSSTYRIIKKH
ncbi:MAG: helix-turn-helix domain-containing protein, partial [Atopobiaceae bacterium]|nr:helix-turn-helix domain-containing protein [Atopobiaceae bacterium]